MHTGGINTLRDGLGRGRERVIGYFVILSHLARGNRAGAHTRTRGQAQGRWCGSAWLCYHPAGPAHYATVSKA